MWVEGMTEPNVWTSKGPLALNETVELPDAEARYLIEREQVIETSDPGAGEPPDEEIEA